MRKFFLISLLSSLSFVGCSFPDAPPNEAYVLSAEGKTEKSTTLGNFVTTAIRRVHRLDIVFYPVDLLDESQVAQFKPGMTKADIEAVLELFPLGTSDNFMLGTMKGSDIKRFIEKRSRHRYQKDLAIAGMRYDVGFAHGFTGRKNFVRETRAKLEDDTYYSVAVSDEFYFNGKTFPGYKYGDGMNFSFRQVNKIISARDSIKRYLQSDRYPWPNLKERRAEVTRAPAIQGGSHPVSSIQGSSHVSPLLGQRVTTNGVVTAAAIREWYPGGIDVYIQSQTPDSSPLTSEGLHLYFEDENVDVRIGQKLTVTGVVYEEVLNQGLGRTSLREITKWSVEKDASGALKEYSLPDPLLIGEGTSSPIPKRHISNFNGNLNLKQSLDLSDGIDFWESLEGMRISVKDIRIVGFRGGREDHPSVTGKVKSYLNLYFVADGAGKVIDNETPRGGIYADTAEEDFNPEIMLLATNHLTASFNTNWVFNVGDEFKDTSISGVLGYERNLFGDGEYLLVMPMPEDFQDIKDVMDAEGKQHRILRPNQRNNQGTKPTPLVSNNDQFTITTYNVENLAGHEDKRINKIAESLGKNLLCPDIVNLVEIQDANGLDFEGSSDGTVTLKKLIEAIPRTKETPCEQVNYDFVNVDPLIHGEGGQPGGNIRVSILYNKNKINFSERPVPNSRTEALINQSGSLDYNPSRVYPNDDAFKGSRKSIVAEFEVDGRKLFIIGNHFNSKLGDKSHWSAVQPPVFKSDFRRINMARKINQFVQRIEQGSPGALILVVGDFNAFPEEASMVTLKGEELFNLSEEFLPPEDRYTTNHNGNSQSLDYIFVNQELLQHNEGYMNKHLGSYTTEAGIEVVHTNSNFMGRLSDHDPVLARFFYPAFRKQQLPKDKK